ncbi:MAG: hypothetical protein ACU84Q_02790 [Gammaproteobacteria bacterium]
MPERLLPLFFLASVIVAQQPTAWAGDVTNDITNASETGDEEDGSAGHDLKAKGAAGRVIEYSSDARGKGIEATPHIREAQETSVESKEKKSIASGKKMRQKKIEQQNSVKLITGGDPTEGSAKVGRLPVLD